ncbi:Alpha/Beta hydrolase protein [Fomitopsis serialis]|uniref:Alpha/Beta hydrolase protein n=1 Tax=Fomitopsis serialis TaxID=139415 RepID=UPI002007A961|nr:Alpha/Beta hydrolase protein [Neoantrodia serialis]KAH9924426.1 Alpha/Beta hydrolase protein [Neoantrodia serialis]
MPLATVDEFGSQCYYVDTGAPPNSNYTTLVLIHGAGFQGAIFERLFVHAAKHNMRLVAVNMRDYAGSTPYSPSDLADLGGDVERQAAALHARGLEILAFLLWYIRKEGIPLLSAKTRGGWIGGGGISLLAWSWGCKMALSCIACAQQLSHDDRELLAGYMRALILLDPSARAFGAPMIPFEDCYNPFEDASLTPDARQKSFPEWASGYYAHSPAILDALPSRAYAEACAGLSTNRIADPPPHQTPTLLRMSSDELGKVANEDVMAHSHMFYVFMDDKVYKDTMRRALHDTSVWPGLRVALLWCDMSVSATVMSSWGLLKEYQDEWPAGGRRIDAVRMKGANHFPHWDYPERTMQLLADIIWAEDIPSVIRMRDTEEVHPRL